MRVRGSVFEEGGEGRAKPSCRRVDGGSSTDQPQGGHTALMGNDSLEGGNAGLSRQDRYRGPPEAIGHPALDLVLVDIHLGEHASAGDHDVSPV